MQLSELRMPVACSLLPLLIKILNMVKFLFTDLIEWIKGVFTMNMINVLLSLIKFTFLELL